MTISITLATIDAHIATVIRNSQIITEIRNSPAEMAKTWDDPEDPRIVAAMEEDRAIIEAAQDFCYARGAGYMDMEALYQARRIFQSQATWRGTGAAYVVHPRTGAAVQAVAVGPLIDIDVAMVRTVTLPDGSQMPYDDSSIYRSADEAVLLSAHA